MSISKLSVAVPISEFKAKCLGLLDAVAREGEEYVITKRGVPIAVVKPIRADDESLMGRWEGLVEIEGDIVHNDWSAEFDVVRDVGR